MHSDNQQSSHLTIGPIDLGFDILQKLPGVESAINRISQDSVRLDAVQADLTTLLKAISNERRQGALRVLSESEAGEITLSDIAEEVAAREYNKTVAGLTSTERKRIYISLKQCHLEKLEDAGLVELGEQECPVIATDDTQPAVEIMRDLETVTGGEGNGV